MRSICRYPFGFCLIAHYSAWDTLTRIPVYTLYVPHDHWCIDSHECIRLWMHNLLCHVQNDWSWSLDSYTVWDKCLMATPDILTYDIDRFLGTNTSARVGTRHTCYGMGWNSCFELFYGMGINNCLKETCYIINNACGTNKVLACIDSIPYIYTSEWFTTCVTSLKIAKYYHGAIKWMSSQEGWCDYNVSSIESANRMNSSIMNVSLQLNHGDAWSMVVVIIFSLKHLSTKRSISHHILYVYNNHTLAVVVDNNTSGIPAQIIPKKSWLIYVIQPTRLVFCISFIMISLFNIINETMTTIIHEYYNIMSESGIFLCEKGIWNMLVERLSGREQSWSSSQCVCGI